MKKIIFLLLLLGLWNAPARSANDMFISDTGAGDQSGLTDCTHAKPAAYFNSILNWVSAPTGAQIGPGTTTHACGTISTLLIFQANGTAGNPITLLFESGAVVQAPVCPFGTGCINMSGRAWVTVDGGVNGIVQNTGNGFGLANATTTKGVLMSQCSNCVVKNLTVANMYVQVPPNRLPVDQNQINAIDFGGGTNVSITHDTAYQCGWCLVQFFNSSDDTGADVSFNDIHDFDHAYALATAGAHAATNTKFHDNKVHDAATWDCGFDGSNPPNGLCHHDGIHLFGTSGSSINGLQVYNNYFYGNWGKSPTGFIFVEGGTGTPSHLSNAAGWNNVFVVPSGATVNTNGWLGIFSGDSGFSQWYNNTTVGPNNGFISQTSNDNTSCNKFGSISSLSFKNNVVSPCGNPVDMGSLMNFDGSNVDFNLYGPSCQNGHNCFVWNGSYKQSFANWRATGGCSGNGHPCDANSVQSDSPLLDGLGVPQAGSPALKTGANLTPQCAMFPSLCSGTSLGGTIPPVPRPVTGNWDKGAYQSGSAPPPPQKPNPPTGLTTTVN